MAHKRRSYYRRTHTRRTPSGGRTTVRGHKVGSSWVSDAFSPSGDISAGGDPGGTFIAGIILIAIILGFWKEILLIVLLIIGIRKLVMVDIPAIDNRVSNWLSLLITGVMLDAPLVYYLYRQYKASGIAAIQTKWSIGVIVALVVFNAILIYGSKVCMGEDIEFEPMDADVESDSIVAENTDDALSDQPTIPAETVDNTSTESAKPDWLDPTTERVMELILDTNQASISLIQRRCGLRYAQAARVLDKLEEHGLVQPYRGARPRRPRVTKSDWEEIKSGNNLYNP